MREVTTVLLNGRRYETAGITEHIKYDTAYSKLETSNESVQTQLGSDFANYFLMRQQ